MLKNEISEAIGDKRLVIFENKDEIETGLLKYNDPPHDTAFLFKFTNEDDRTFHTIGMKFDIDIYFYNKDKELVNKKLSCKPGVVVESKYPCKYVLEIAS